MTLYAFLAGACKFLALYLALSLAATIVLAGLFVSAGEAE